ncbi:hypothetical protein ACGFI9_35615 [Micromonospora sp. NPDC048930]|uniref:hypothetical protein n=1 Tax=Micromonospora sp. NPDC048930 TaxID=3364261 RepID=UPI00371336BD
MTPPLTLQTATRPGDVVQAAGRWLGEDLALCGFRWLASTATLQRSLGERVEQIVLQGSTRNRAGKQLLVSLQVVVRDRALLRWQRAHPEVALSGTDWLVGHPLGYVAGRVNGCVYGCYDDGVFDLLDPAGRPATVAAVSAVIRHSVLPWLEETARPDLMMAAPSITLELGGSSILEWLASQGRTDLINQVVNRVVSSRPGMRDRVERGGQLAQRGQWPSPDDRAEALGWSAEMLTGGRDGRVAHDDPVATS